MTGSLERLINAGHEWSTLREHLHAKYQAALNAQQNHRAELRKRARDALGICTRYRFSKRPDIMFGGSMWDGSRWVMVDGTKYHDPPYCQTEAAVFVYLLTEGMSAEMAMRGAKI